MSKKLPYLLTCLFAALTITTVSAQEYQTIPISGFNADVIANGVGTTISSTSIDIDGVNYNYLAQDFQLTANSSPLTYGIPSNGLITSVIGSTPGLTYQLAPLTGNNSLRLPTASPSGTLTFTTPTAAITLYMLAVTGSGTGTVDVVVNFSDNTTQLFTGITVGDWFGGANYAISGIGRINRNTDMIENPFNDPRMYQVPLAISLANQSKAIASVDITKTSNGNGVVNVFAFSAEAYTSCPSPTGLAYTSSMTGATVTWDVPYIAPAGYDYYLTTSVTPPVAGTVPTGSVVTNTATITGLPGVTYYFWVRSSCDANTKGVWKLITLTPGQVYYAYQAGADISTQYQSTWPVDITPDSSTTCPGEMSITVPPGYKIASVGTTYNMTAYNGAWQSEQRSLLVCTTNGEKEGQLASTSGSGGTHTYSRTGINIATGLTGTVDFELRAWRTWEGDDTECGSAVNKVDADTWKIIVTYALDSCTTPDAPTATDQNVCPTATFADLSATGIVGAVYTWFTVPTGGDAIPSNAPVTAGTYYVSQTVGTCESDRSAAVVVTLNPTAVPIASDQGVCGGSTVADLETLTGVNINWYAAATGGTALASTTALVSGNYFASQTVNGCESTRISVAVVVNTTPPPTASQQIFCAGSGATVAELQATAIEGATLNWYASATAPAALATTALLNSGTYYVSQTFETCESTRTSVNVAVSTIVAPTVFVQELCTGATVADLQASGGATATYKWFDSQSSTTPLELTTPVVEGTYYVTQTLGTCESPKASVQVNINSIGEPEIDDQEFCNGATVANIIATPSTGAVIKWYATEDATVALTPTAALISGTYFASQKLNTCESGRVAVEITVNAVVPAPPSDPIMVCTTATIADLTVEAVEGATLNWYANNTIPTALSPDALAPAGTYYVSQTVGTCEGPRASVVVTQVIVAEPQAEGGVVCNGTLFSEVSVDGVEGATFNWYTTLDGTVQVAEDAVVTAGTFYVSQSVGSCEGGRIPVAFSITTTAAPQPQATQSFCGETFAAALSAGATAGYTVNWYSPAGDPITGNSALASGIYTVTQTNNGCESAAAPVTVVVNAIPDVPGGDDSQEFDTGDTVADLEIETVEGAEVHWYFLDEDVWFSIPSTSVLTDGFTYGVTQSVGDCESDKLAITADNILGNKAFELKNIRVYPNPSSDVINVRGNETLSGVTIFNLLGQEVIRQSVNADTVQVTVSSLPQATYIMQVNAVNGGTATFKIVKQ